MKEFQKGILDNERVISAENVQRMGEVIALCCIKTVMARSGKDLHKLYADLLHDINREKGDYSPFSNAYDIAQEAMLFLCQHMGKRLDDVCVNKTGRKITIVSLPRSQTPTYFQPFLATKCLSVLDSFLRKDSSV